VGRVRQRAVRSTLESKRLPDALEARWPSRQRIDAREEISLPKRIGLMGVVWVLIATALATASADAQSAAGAGLKQYRSDGHVLGFGTDGYYLSNGTYAVKVEFMGAAPVAPAGHDGEAADSEAGGGTAPLSRVSYAGLWKGISVHYDAPGMGIARSTWHLEPGAQPRAIRLRYNRPVKLNPDGTLTVVASERGVLCESAPLAWQEVDGERRPVRVKFAITGATGETRGAEVGFALGAYDLARPLEIDPTLQWNTFLGSGLDDGHGIAVDRSGNVYVVGESASTWGGPVRPYTEGIDVFAAKLDARRGAGVEHLPGRFAE
jgi:hypothetical protein